MDVLPSAFKHGVSVDDREDAVRNALAIDGLDDDLRLHIGPSRSGPLLEVISLRREGDRGELVIHACGMAMRPKYRRLLPGE